MSSSSSSSSSRRTCAAASGIGDTEEGAISTTNRDDNNKNHHHDGDSNTSKNHDLHHQDQALTVPLKGGDGNVDPFAPLEVTVEDHRKRVGRNNVINNNDNNEEYRSYQHQHPPPAIPRQRIFGQDRRGLRRRSVVTTSGVSSSGGSASDYNTNSGSNRRSGPLSQLYYRRSYSLGNIFVGQNRKSTSTGSDTSAAAAGSGGGEGDIPSLRHSDRTVGSGGSSDRPSHGNIGSSSKNSNTTSNGGGSGSFRRNSSTFFVDATADVHGDGFAFTSVIVPMNPFEAGDCIEDDTAASVGEDASIVHMAPHVSDPFGGQDLAQDATGTITASHSPTKDDDDNDDGSIEDDEEKQQQRQVLSSRPDVAPKRKVMPRVEHFKHQTYGSFEVVGDGENQQCLDVANKVVDNDTAKDESTKADMVSHVESGINDVDNNVTSSSSRPKAPSRSVLTAGIESFKYLYSLVLLIFCVVLVMGAIFTQQTTMTSPSTAASEESSTDDTTDSQKNDRFPTVGAFFIFWFLIIWLAFLEGGQGALVGLQPIDRSLYKDSHPRSYKNTKVVHGDRVDRFIVGRQFLVVLVVFVMQLMSSPVQDIQLWGLSPQVTEIFLKSGLALMVVTIVLGQLVAQLSSTNCMLDFINNYFMLYFVSYLSLVIEFSGLLHSVYLVQWVFSRFTNKPEDTNPVVDTPSPRKSLLEVAVDSDNTSGVDNIHHTITVTSSDEEKGTSVAFGPQLETSTDDASVASTERTVCQSVFFCFRVMMSLGILSFAFAVTLSALFSGKTTMWKGVHPAASIVLFFLLMCFVGLMEGLQIALFAVRRATSQDKLADQHPRAYRNCDLVFRDDNLSTFLIGRQICVTICTFIIARITTIDIQEGEENIFGVSDGMQAFFNTGLLGAVITTIISSLAWRVVASAFPVSFLSNPLVNPIVRLCLFLEASGLCSSAWVIARLQRQLMRYRSDDSYIDKEKIEDQKEELLSTRDREIDRFINVSRFTLSLGLLTFSIVLVCASIFSRQTTFTATADMGGKEVSPFAAFAILFCLLIWLYFLEGAQGTLIGLQSVDQMKYTESHPNTFKSTSVAYIGDNLERFIVGRQFIVLAIVFLSQWLTSPIQGISVLGLPPIVIDIFLSSGLAVVLTVIMLGQLCGQVNAATCMLDFTNNLYTVYFVTYLSILVEQTGLLHSVYFFQIVFSKLAREPIQSKEPQRTTFQAFFFWLRVALSMLVLGFSLAVSIDGIMQGKTDAWINISTAGTLVIFFVLICFVGLMEGLQIAVFSVAGLAEDELASHPMARSNVQTIFANLQSVLIGRQILVTVTFFILARITTQNVQVGIETNTFGVSNGVQELFNTGMLGAMVTTVVASLIWRIFASLCPVMFMSNPIIVIIVLLCRITNDTGICNASWVLGRWNKLIVDLQPDEVYLDGCDKEGKDPITRRDKDIDVTVSVIKYGFSTGLLFFAIAVTVSLIITGQTELSKNTHPAVAFVLLWVLLGWLGMMEGGQGCLVGTQGIPKQLYEDSHPKALKSTAVAHKGNNLARFIVGRQFLVVLVVFIINMCGAPIKGSNVFNLPSVANSIFVDSNLSLILITVIIGQLMAQVNAASCMLDFINNYIMVFGVTYVSLAIEWSGILHAVYLLQMIFSKLSHTPIDSSEAPSSFIQTMFFWGRVLISLAILSFALAVTFTALLDGKTTAASLPGAASIILFIVLMSLAGLLEGLQIAMFAVVRLPKQEWEKSKVAKAICHLTFSGDNLSSFLIGRQILVTLCTFVIAWITTLNVQVGEGENIFGVPDGVQTFFNTGLLGAVITTIFGSLIWRVFAASYPIAFLSNPLMYVLLRVCLLLQSSGVCTSALLLALVNRQIIGYQPDEHYVGKKEEWEAELSAVEGGKDEHHGSTKESEEEKTARCVR